MKRFVYAGGRFVRFVLSSLFGALVVIVVLGIYQLNNRPDLSVWHSQVLDEEFRADSDVESFAQYLALEDRLFAQLDQLVYAKLAPEDRGAINRYDRGSMSDPQGWPHNWNRSFVLPADKPAMGALLLHGMSDSPYSMRSIGETLHQHGAYVIGMRMPGHGQAPSGLVDVHWEDMAAAVRLGIGELANQVPGGPLVIVGYSNGGALAVEYALATLDNPELPTLAGLVLLSPEIGISKLARLAYWQERIGRLLGLEKLRWQALLPEYDPWKYNSFALNAVKQAYRITHAIQRGIDRQAAAGNLARMPPILAFQSVVDTTVTAAALVDNLFARLPARSGLAGAGHELVAFDINRYAAIEPLMNGNPSGWISSMLDDRQLPYAFTLLSNYADASESVIAYTRVPGAATLDECATGMVWPRDVYSLSHVALPFSPDDPQYGNNPDIPSPGIKLGTVALRGEKNVLQVSSTDMLRLRFNPFYAYFQQRMLAFLKLADSAGGACNTP
jgi:alpha-beta hydrolase superfamily lysophospholipase